MAEVEIHFVESETVVEATGREVYRKFGESGMPGAVANMVKGIPDSYLIMLLEAATNELESRKGWDDLL